MHHEAKLVLIVHVINHPTKPEAHEILNNTRNSARGVKSALHAAVSEEVLVGQSAAAGLLFIDFIFSAEREAVANLVTQIFRF